MRRACAAPSLSRGRGAEARGIPPNRFILEVIMQVEVKDLSSLEKQFEVVLSKEETQSEADKKLIDLQKKVKLRGFRPGKVPMTMVKQFFQDEVHRELVEKTVTSFITDKYKEKSFAPIGHPKVEFKSSKPGEELRFLVTFELVPEFSLADFSQFEIEKKVVAITEADVQKTIDNARKAFASFKEAADPKQSGQKGDFVLVDYDLEFKADDGSLKNESHNDFRFELGGEAVIAPFQNALYGKKPGDQVKFTVKANDQDFGPNLAGKEISFVVRVKKILTPELPEVNEDFIRKIGGKEGTLESLKDKIRKDLEESTKSILEVEFEKNLMEKLIDAHDFPLPPSLQAEIDNIGKQQGTEKTLTPEVQKGIEESKKATLRRFKLDIILDKVIKELNVTGVPEELQKEVQAFAQESGDPQKFFQHLSTNPGSMQMMQAMYMRSKAMNVISSKVKTKETQITIKDASDLLRKSGELRHLLHGRR
jgi:trigger factor